MPTREASQSHQYDRSVTLVKDGLEARRVRVENKDAQGEHLPWSMRHKTRGT